jgi:two-component system chemotaxis response regulator CheB
MSIAAIEQELAPKIKAICGGAQPVPLPVTPPTVRAGGNSAKRIDIVAIGTSTGGPNALAEVVPRLPAGFPVPVVIVQHMPATFTSLLAERLSRSAVIPVSEGTSGTVLTPSHAWLAPGNFHMTVVAPTLVANGKALRLALNQDSPEHSCRPAVDVLFRSVAAAAGEHVLGVVMTGMGADGVLGARKIREAGGEVIIQDQASSVVWGMPGAVHAAGQADGVFPLDKLAVEITRRVQNHRTARQAAAATTPKLESSLK